ncbi:MAG: MBOAT family protein, partial [Selenomonas sp.]|nr:MBOAT family protein [Selenomonas sp.]
MLFNSYEFICWFFPVVILVYFLLGKRSSNRFALGWLSLASLFFYSYWNVSYLPLLLFSVLMNYVFAGLIISAVEKGRSACNKLLFYLALAANLSLLGWYKYADFLINNINHVFSTDYPLLHIILPLGISFFTI